jgi:hypothetical protein
LRELPRQRMFPTARTDEQDIHVRK